jgi:SAM-dependent methyltransferase
VAEVDLSLRKLNVGCGFDRREGYLNVDFQDFHEPDLVADVRDMAALPDGHFEEVLATDVLEHLPRSDTLNALREWQRVLVDGGRLHLQVPDVLGVAYLLRTRDSAAEHDEYLHSLFGTQAYAGDFHLAGFTDLHLIECLAATGFDHIALERRDYWMIEADAYKTSASRAAAYPLAIGLDWGVGAIEGRPPDTYRWCATDAEILVVDIAPHAVRTRLSLRLSGHANWTKVPLRLTAAGVDKRIVVRRRRTQWQRDVMVDPAAPLRLRIHSDGPPVDSPGDDRDLRFRLFNFEATPLG